MNAFRTRLNVLGLEGRDMPSATLPVAAPSADGTGYNDGQLILRVAAADPATGVAGHVRAFDGVNESLLGIDSRPGSGVLKATDGATGVSELRTLTLSGPFAPDHNVIYVGTANGGVWKTT